MGTIKESLNNKWRTLDEHIGEGKFNLQRIDENCLANLYLGSNEIDNRCLLHDLKGVNIEFVGFEKNNLRAYKSDKFLILELIGGYNYFDIFTDLSLALLNSLSDIGSPQESARIFQTMILKWSDFFSNAKPDRLSENELIGLWGEIYVLTSLITESKHSVNDVLKSWRGPYNSNRDFEFEYQHIEVKTIKKDSESIEISSEFQLFRHPNIKIELSVLKIDTAEDGLTLGDLISEALKQIIDRRGNSEVFLSAIMRKIDLVRIGEYEGYRFKKNSLFSFDVEDDNFPRICPQNLMDGVFKVKYKLKLDKIDSFIKINL